MRYFFEISYHGKNYHGWQTQRNALGVQTVVEQALSKITREEVRITGSGRTDTGVHCFQQFFHADIESPFEQARLLQRMNAFLPRDIAIRSIRPVVPEAHARRDALWRTYVYRIVQAKEPLQAGLALHVFKSLDLRTMKRGCALIRGVHDFRSFSKVKTDVNHFVCDVRQATWKRTGTQLAFTITANRFLRGMVRALVGTFLDLGAGEISLKDLHHILQSKDRKMAGANVPPYGLYLMHVQYPRSIFI